MSTSSIPESASVQVHAFIETATPAMPTTSSPVKTTTVVAAPAIPKPLLLAPRFPVPQVQGSETQEAQTSKVVVPEIQPTETRDEIQETRGKQGEVYVYILLVTFQPNAKIILTYLFSKTEEEVKSRTPSSRNQKTSWNIL